MSVVILMRWHVELKRDITEYVLTLRRLSWNYDVRLDIMMLICKIKKEQNNCLLKKLNGRLNIMMLALTL